MSSITGGCLCGSIRFEISLKKAGQWPPTSESCQCTMCRKWSGALLYQYLYLSPEQLSPPLSAFATYREYGSTPGRYRGFCRECGSSLIWRSDRETECLKVDLLLGTIDEKWLIGTGEAGEKKGGLGKILCKPSGAQHWVVNAIPGVTDHLQTGTMYLCGKEGPVVEPSK
ncbi:Mss4-like protein [Aspergillus heterothallicus]